MNLNNENAKQIRTALKECFYSPGAMSHQWEKVLDNNLCNAHYVMFSSLAVSKNIILTLTDVFVMVFSAL